MNERHHHQISIRQFARYLFPAHDALLSFLFDVDLQLATESESHKRGFCFFLGVTRYGVTRPLEESITDINSSVKIQYSVVHGLPLPGAYPPSRLTSTFNAIAFVVAPLPLDEAEKQRNHYTEKSGVN